MSLLGKLFGLGSSRDATSSLDIQRGPSIVAVADVALFSSGKIDEQVQKIEGAVDLRTDPFNGSWAEAPFTEKWICRYKNFFLGRTKRTYYVDDEGRMIRASTFSGIFPTRSSLNDSLKHYVNALVVGVQCLKEKELPDGRIKVLYAQTEGHEYRGARKVTEFGYTLSEDTASHLKIKQHPSERYFNVFRIVQNWQDQPNVYNPEELADFKEFCRICNIGRIVFPPKSIES